MLLNRYFMAGVAAALVLALGFAYWQGRDDQADKINEENREAVTDADQAEIALRRCLDRGGVYDFATGNCAGPE